MSGAEETTPTVNPPPAVVPSPDDSAKEGTGQDKEADGNNEVEREEQEEEREEEQEKLKMEEPIEDDEDDLLLGDENEEPAAESVPVAAERLDSIDPSYNPSREELLYEGDMETEIPSVKVAADKEVGAQDEGFIVSVHDTGMELDMTESLTSHSKTATTTSTTDTSSSGAAAADSTLAKTSQSSRHSMDMGGAKTNKTTPTVKSGTSTDSKKSDKSSGSPNKSPDRFVDYLNIVYYDHSFAGQAIQTMFGTFVKWADTIGTDPLLNSTN